MYVDLVVILSSLYGKEGLFDDEIGYVDNIDQN